MNPTQGPTHRSSHSVRFRRAVDSPQAEGAPLRPAARAAPTGPVNSAGGCVVDRRRVDGVGVVGGPRVKAAQGEVAVAPVGRAGATAAREEGSHEGPPAISREFKDRRIGGTNTVRSASG